MKNRLKKCVVEIPETKEFCLLYSILYLLHSTHIKRPADRKYYEPMMHLFNTDGFQFPIPLKQIPKFIAKNNHINMKVNIFHCSSSGEITPVEYGLGAGKRIINLLIVENNDMGHIMPIVDLNRLLRSTYRNGNGKMRYKTSYFCENCLGKFGKESLLEKHKKLCLLNRPFAAKCPDEEGKGIFFKNVEYTVEQPLVAFLDFECVLTPEEEKCDICNTIRCKCSGKSYTRTENMQTPFCYAFVIISSKNEIIYEVSYTGKFYTSVSPPTF